MTKSNSTTLPQLLEQSSITTLIAHLPRVGLNIVSASEPKPTIKEFFVRAAKALPYNYTRGTGIFFTQLAAQKHFPDYPNLSPIVTGAMVASILETPTIIKTNTDTKLPLKPKFTRFSISLTACYGWREAGFVFAVMHNTDAPPWKKHLLFVGGVLASSAFHKFAVLEAIKDLPRAGSVTMPRLKEGPRLVANIAKGYYTHPAFLVPFPSPANYWQGALNLSHVIFPPKVILARGCYLAIFKGAFFIANPSKRAKLIDSVSQTLGLKTT